MDATTLLTMYGALGLIAVAMALFKWNQLRKKKAENWKPTEMDPPATPAPAQNPEPEPIVSILDELGLPKAAAQPPVPSEEEGLFATKSESIEPEEEPRKQRKKPGPKPKKRKGVK